MSGVRADWLTPARPFVRETTMRCWEQAGLIGAPGSPLYMLLQLYDDTDDVLTRKALLRVARQIHALTPLAACRVDPEPVR